MKTGIHPVVHNDAKIKCSCGKEYIIPGTKKDIHIEICSACHPFYTGKMKVIDTAGRIDKFKARQAMMKEKTNKKD